MSIPVSRILNRKSNRLSPTVSANLTEALRLHAYEKKKRGQYGTRREKKGT